jgi:hypothetical protein
MADTAAHALLGGMGPTVLMTPMNVLCIHYVNMAGRVETLLDHSRVAVLADGRDMYVILTSMIAHLIPVHMAVHAWTELTVLLAHVPKAGLELRAIPTLMNVM